MVFLAIPVVRTVARIDMPSTRHPITWARRSVLNLFMCSLSQEGGTLKVSLRVQGGTVRVEWATVIEDFRQDAQGRDVAVGIGAETSTVDQFPGEVRVIVLAYLSADYDELGATVEETG